MFHTVLSHNNRFHPHVASHNLCLKSVLALVVMNSEGILATSSLVVVVVVVVDSNVVHDVSSQFCEVLIQNSSNKVHLFHLCRRHHPLFRLHIFRSEFPYVVYITSRFFHLISHRTLQYFQTSIMSESSAIQQILSGLLSVDESVLCFTLWNPLRFVVGWFLLLTLVCVLCVVLSTTLHQLHRHSVSVSSCLDVNV